MLKEEILKHLRLVIRANSDQEVLPVSVKFLRDIYECLKEEETKE
jgi:hypothetical protein